MSVALEFYLCGAFHLIDFTRIRGIWCDGVLELSIERMERRSFLIAGIAFSPNKLAPFEIEFHFARRRDHRPTRTIIRFGEPDADGEIRWLSKLKNPQKILAERPQRDHDWAVAVELAPTET